MVVKSDKKGLRLYDRNTSTKSAASAIVYSYNFQDNIDFSKVINDLKAGFERRTQIGIVDNEGDVVYYIANLIEWPKTKLKGLKYRLPRAKIKKGERGDLLSLSIVGQN